MSASLTIHGKIPERPNGSDCKSDVTDFGSSNLPLPTTKRRYPYRVAPFVLFEEIVKSSYVRLFAQVLRRDILEYVPCFSHMATPCRRNPLAGFRQYVPSFHHKKTRFLTVFLFLLNLYFSFSTTKRRTPYYVAPFIFLKKVIEKF